MSDWIEDLKRKQTAQQDKEALERKWRLHCYALIDAAAPELWRELVARVREDVERLAAAFPDQASMHLEFNDHNSADHFTLANPSLHVNFSCYFVPSLRKIGIEFRRRPDVFAAVQVSKEEIAFEVGDRDQVFPVFGRQRLIPNIVERLVKELLPS